MKEIAEKKVLSYLVKMLISLTRPEVRAIAQKIIRQEGEKPFLEKFVTYAGYPDWGKSVTLSKSIGGSAATIGKTGSTDHNYSALVTQKMDAIRQTLINNGAFNPQSAMTEINNLINNIIKPAINSHPNTPINQLIF